MSQMLKERPNDPEEEMKGPELSRSPESRFKREMLQNKSAYVASMMKLMQLQREDNESLVNSFGYCPDDKVPKELLMPDGQEGQSELFTNAKEKDSINEMRPSDL